MLKNYWKIAWRNLQKSKAFSLINITGLAAGLACFLLIALWVSDELSYDRFHEKADRIYRVQADIRFGGSDLHLAVASDPMGKTLKADYPEVEEYTRVYNSNGSKLIRKGSQFINESRLFHADSTFFRVFTFPALQGDPANGLNEPNTVVISESGARKYFGTTDAVGKFIETNDDEKTLYKVTAVIKDMPANSHMQADLVFSMKNVHYQEGNFLSNNHFCYIVLRPGTDPKTFEKHFAEVETKYILPQAKLYTNIKSMDEFRQQGNMLEYSLMPLTDIHLKSDRFPELSVNGSMQYVYIFSIVAFFVLLIACINFMNLATARSAGRAREVGIRKVLGTDKKALITQFLTESTMMVLLSMLVSIVIAWLVLPWFNGIAGKQYHLTDLLNPRSLPFLLVLPVVIGFLSGLYPAFFLSSFQPIKVLKGKINAGFRKSNLRSGLVVLQFGISVFLIVATIVVYRQLNFIQHTRLGFSKDQLLIIDGTGALGEQHMAYKNGLLGVAGVKGATYSGYLPVNPSSRSDNTWSKTAVLSAASGLNMQDWSVDEDYIPVMGMEIVKGRNFSRQFGTDSTALVINETAARKLGEGDPIGKKLYRNIGPEGDEQKVFTVIGVVRDFHFESLKQEIGPLCMELQSSPYTLTVKTDASNMKEVLAAAEQNWKKMVNDKPFQYRFMDESFSSMYNKEKQIGQLGLSFAIIAILIACLGLLGLAAYMAEQRTKEIGVRKVLGATVTDIVSLLSKDFLKLILIALLIALPLAGWVMHQWLQDFSLRAGIAWWVYLLGAGVALVITFLTISSQAIRAALNNPVKSLRSE